jgi:opacity protein-like surface antigen
LSLIKPTSRLNPMQHLHSLPVMAAGLLAATALLATAGQAEETAKPDAVPDPTGFYATLGVGASWPQDVNGNTSVFGVPVNANYNLGGGFAGEVGAGYDFGPVRTELTYSYTNATLNNVTATALGVSGNSSISNGNVNTNSVLVSAYLDIPTNSRWVPYIGGGIGYTNVGWGAYNATAFGVTLTQEAGNQSVFGYQAKLGVSYLASKSTDIFAEGIYQGTSGFTVNEVNYDPLGSWGARVGARLRF